MQYLKKSRTDFHAVCIKKVHVFLKVLLAQLSELKNLPVVLLAVSKSVSSFSQSLSKSPKVTVTTS